MHSSCAIGEQLKKVWTGSQLKFLRKLESILMRTVEFLFKKLQGCSPRKENSNRKF